MTDVPELEEVLWALREASAAAVTTGRLSDEDVAILNQASLILNPNGQSVRSVVGALERADHAGWRIGNLTEMLEAARSIACRAILTEPIQRHLKARGARTARRGRSSLKQEREKIAGQFAHMKADEALPLINEQLKKKRLENISLPTLYRWRSNAKKTLNLSD